MKHIRFVFNGLICYSNNHRAEGELKEGGGGDSGNAFNFISRISTCNKSQVYET
jgi:hypothetical protein